MDLVGSQRGLDGAEAAVGGVHALSSSSGPGLGATQGPGLDSAQGQGPVKMSSLVARPHHIPKMNDSLAKRMEDIRKTMGNDGNGRNHPPSCQPLTHPHASPAP